jgi:hypothetical protein
MGPDFYDSEKEYKIFHEHVQSKIDNMTPESARALLDRTGFYDSDGKLLEELRDFT